MVIHVYVVLNVSKVSIEFRFDRAAGCLITRGYKIHYNELYHERL